MGNGVSLNANDNTGTTVQDMKTFKALQSAYESSKELENVALFDLLVDVYETNQESNSPLTDTTEALSEVVESARNKTNEETPEEREAKAERNKSFIVACGAFHKGSAKADISKAQKLFEDGVDVDHLDSDG
jgi:hypothetical protein